MPGNYTPYAGATYNQVVLLQKLTSEDSYLNPELYEIARTRDYTKISKTNMSTVIKEYFNGNTSFVRERLLTLPAKKYEAQNVIDAGVPYQVTDDEIIW